MKPIRPHINFSSEQEMLLDVAEKFARDKSPLEQVRKKIAQNQPFDQALWQEITDLGWHAITIPEALGGSGLGLGEAVAILEPLGRQLFSTPLLNSIIIAEILKKLDCQSLLRKLAQGTQMTLALNENQGDWALDQISVAGLSDADKITLSNKKILITDADKAEMILLSIMFKGSPHLMVIQKQDYARHLKREIVIDETKRSFQLELDGLGVQETAIIGRLDPSMFAFIQQVGTLLIVAEICGGMAGTLALVLDHLKTRKQFGHFIGAYQALKHPTVDMALQLEAARSHLYYAAALAPDSQEAVIATHMAKAVASDGFAFAADRAIQFLGAFGFSYECNAQLYLRRALWCQYQMGDASYHRQELAKLLL